MASNKGPNQRYSTPNRSANSSQDALDGLAGSIYDRLSGDSARNAQLLRLHSSVLDQWAVAGEKGRERYRSKAASPKTSSTTADWVGRPTVKK